MSAVVIASATCFCPMSTNQTCALQVSSQSVNLVEGKPVATIMDCTSGNLPSFGLCNSLGNPTTAAQTAAALGVLTPGPCMAAYVGPWQCGNSNVMADNKPVLTSDGKLSCGCGGTISIQNPGQTKKRI